MKKLQTLAACATAVLMACSLTACGSDDEGNGSNIPGPTTPPSGATEFTPETYAGQAAKYNITGGYSSSATGGKTVESVELLGDGGYIVTFVGASSYTQKKEADVKVTDEKDVLRLFKSHKRTTRGGSYDPYHAYGKYTVKADGTIVLNDMELSMKIAAGASTITFTDNQTGRSNTVSVSKQQTATGVNSQKLCRTWLFEEMEVWYIEDGVNVLHVKFNAIDNKILAFQMHPSLRDQGITEDGYIEGMTEDNPKEVTFSPSGTYYLLYGDGSREYSSWGWKDENRGIMFDYDNDDETGEGEETLLNITFSGTRAYVAADVTFEERDWETDAVHTCRTVSHMTLLAK